VGWSAQNIHIQTSFVAWKLLICLKHVWNRLWVTPSSMSLSVFETKSESSRLAQEAWENSRPCQMENLAGHLEKHHLTIKFVNSSRINSSFRRACLLHS